MTTPLATDDAAQQQRPAASTEEVRNLTTLAGEDLAKEIFKLWTSQDRLYRTRREQWKVNRARRQGVSGVALVKRTDTQEWVAYAPPGSAKQVPALNKAARLCRLLRATLFVDPPEPEGVPATDTDEDRDAAEFATRVLIDQGSESNLDNANTAAQAFDLANVYDSGFRRYWVDPTGGGQRPMAVQALATAQAINPTDPASPIKDAAGNVVPNTEQTPYVTKYVRRDFTLTDDPRDPGVQRQWLPKLKCEVLKAPNVRFLPATSRDVWAAQGVLVFAYIALGELRKRFGASVPTDPEVLKKLTAFQAQTEDLLPGGKKITRAALESQPVSDDALVPTITIYYTAGPTYPRGFYAVAAGAGGELVLHRGTWYNEQADEPLDVPVDQFKQFDDEDDPMGMGMMRILGPGNEIRAAQLGGMLEHLDRFLNRKVFYPITSSLQPRSMQAATGTYIPINPGGQPFHEQVPEFPKATMDMFGLISSEMEHESGLEAPATGQNPPSVQSGLHARTIIEQVHVGLSEPQQNAVRGLQRGWRIQLQLIKLAYRVPQQISWVGDDGAYKQRAWTASDLGSTRDVVLHKGTLSMLAPSAKAAVAEQMFAIRDPTTGRGLLGIEELESIVRGNVGGLLGLQDNPHRQRIKRQLEAWGKGPPPDWQPPPPQAVDPATGQPAPQAPDPALAAIFTAEPVDDEPTVAIIRHFELSRFLSSTRANRHPPEWKAGLTAEYERAKKAAGIVTVPEQEAMQEQQAAAEQQAQQDALAQQQGTQDQLGAQVQQVLGEAQAAVQGLAQATEERLQVVEQALAEQGKQTAQVGEALTAHTQAMERLPQELQQQMAQATLEVERRFGDLKSQILEVVSAKPPPITIQTSPGAKGAMTMTPEAPEPPEGPKVYTVQRGPDGKIAAVVEEGAGRTFTVGRDAAGRMEQVVAGPEETP